MSGSESTNSNKCVHKLFFLKFILILTLIFLVTSPIYAQSTSEFEELFDEAVQLIKEKKFQTALIKTRDLLKIDPHNFVLQSNECSILLELNMLNDAEKCLTNLLEKTPDDLLNRNNLGALYSKMGNYELAKEQFEMVISKDPNYITARANLIVIDYKLGHDLEQLIQHGKQLLSEDKSNLQILNNNAKFLTELGEYDDAKELLDLALEIDEKYANAFENMGVLFARQGDFQSAESNFIKALRLSPDDVSILNNLGLLYRDLGDRHNDINYYQKSIGYYESVLIFEDNQFAKDGIKYSEEKKARLILNNDVKTIGISLAAGVISGVIGTILLQKKRGTKAQKQDEESDEKPRLEESQIFKKVRKVTVVSYGAIAGLIFIMILAGLNPVNQTNDDLRNWTSIIISSGIGIFVAILVWMVTSEGQKNTNSLIRKIEEDSKKIQEISAQTKEILEKQEDDRKLRLEFLSLAVNSLPRIKRAILHNEKLLGQFTGVQEDDSFTDSEMTYIIYNVLEDVDELIKVSNVTRGIGHPDVEKNLDELCTELKKWYSAKSPYATSEYWKEMQNKVISLIDSILGKGLSFGKNSS